MVEIRKTGSIFKSGAEMLVNPVNCVGSMGKGLAKEFRQRFPENYEAYRKAVQEGKMKPGGCLIHRENGVWICNAATKNHWRDPSRLEWVREAISVIAKRAVTTGVATVAVPALGCGFGGLSWEDVKPLMTPLYQPYDITFFIYEPQ